MANRGHDDGKCGVLVDEGLEEDGEGRPMLLGYVSKEGGGDEPTTTTTMTMAMMH